MKYDRLTKKVSIYDPKFGDHRMCECGHSYVVHFNPKTKRSWGCFFSYNCDCEEFREAKSKVR